MLRQGHLLQGRYRVLRELGQGGMGAVYEATDEKFGTPVALKEIIFEPADAQQRSYLAAAFEREAKSLATARHECIPFVRDYFQEKDHEYLIMELVEGDDLGHLLDERKKPFSVDEGIDWLRQLLDALDYLHGLDPQIIHRDIKPQNLKVSGRGRLKLLDFGIAKSGDRSMVTTRKQTFIGATLDYSPIEQIMRVIDATFREFILLKHRERADAILSQVTDSRADIFSTGGTFYHLLTYHVPEDATRRTLAVWEGNPDPLPHPSDIRPSIPRVFGDFLLKAMAIERDDRFQTADEMLQALETVVAEMKKPAAADASADSSPTHAKTVRLLDEQLVHFEPHEIANKRPDTIEPVIANTNWGLVSDTDPKHSLAYPEGSADQHDSVENEEIGLVTNWAPLSVDDREAESTHSASADTNWASPGVTEPAFPGEPEYQIVAPAKGFDISESVNTDSSNSGSFMFSSGISNTSRGLARMIIPAAAAVGTLFVLGIAMVVWIGSSVGVQNAPVSNEPVRSSVPPAEIPSPAVSSTVPVVEPTPDVFSFPGDEKRTESPKTPAQKPAKLPEKKASPVTKQKPSQDPNCIYTDTCK